MPVFIDAPPPTEPTPPPTTLISTPSTESTNIMDLTSSEQDTTIHYEVTDWSTTIKFIPAAPSVQPMATTTESNVYVVKGVEVVDTTTLGIVTFPEEVETTPRDRPHTTHKLDHLRGGHGSRGSGQGKLVAPHTLSSSICALLLLVITTNLLLV